MFLGGFVASNSSLTITNTYTFNPETYGWVEAGYMGSGRGGQGLTLVDKDSVYPYCQEEEDIEQSMKVDLDDNVFSSDAPGKVTDNAKKFKPKKKF